ncbi:stage V sporulation protein E [Clostridium chrysemydis]|uniref:stage V sporulation protein E n=1 Tax=Clostridium chrysemydis TaxID=2665504 RepID=UPI00188462B8|nr:stage V sporulation protein E [Clostridium chrysemydis]
MRKRKQGRNSMGAIDYGIFCTIILLLSIGVVMVYSASSYYAMFHFKDSTYFLKRQLAWSAVGIIVMMFMMSIDYHKIKKFTLIAMICTVPLLLAVFLFPGVNGAQRWIQLGPASFQPSELAKYVVVLYLAMALSSMGDRVKDFKKGIIPCFAIGGFYAGLVLAQKNLSIAAVIMIVTFIVVFAAGARRIHMFGVVTPVLTAAALFFALFEPYRRARMLNFVNPWKDPAGNGYQLIQSFYALGAGGVLGLGLGQSRQKTLYMPEPHNDFIFSIIGEELGLVGCIFIILLFVIFVWRGVKIASSCKDSYGTYLALGITSIIAVQAIINIAVVTGSMPVTGVPLPFISYGGSSLVINMTAMGILLNISRQRKNDKLKEKEN